MLNQITHVLLDAARLGDRINEAIKLNKAHDSLYRGGLEQKLSSVAPYLFRFQANTPFADWYMENGWGDSWGILFRSAYEMPDLHKHFRKFLKVETEAGQQMYFRFYDPRVLRVFLPNSDVSQIREFFGPVEYFIAADEDARQMLRFTQTNGTLKTQKTLLADVYQAPVKKEPVEADMTSTEEAIKQESEPKMAPVSQAAKTVTPEKPAEPASKPKPSKWNMFD